MKFQVGDIVIHAHHGAAKIVDIEDLKLLGSGKTYYVVKLLDDTGTRVWVAINDAEDGNLRLPIGTKRLDQVYNTLRTKPLSLPSDHKERYEIVEQKLGSGDPVQIAEAVRDLSWKNYHIRSLTSEGRRLYERGLEFLTSEVAVIEHDEFASVKAKISDVVQKTVATHVPLV